MIKILFEHFERKRLECMEIDRRIDKRTIIKTVVLNGCGGCLQGTFGIWEDTGEMVKAKHLLCSVDPWKFSQQSRKTESWYFGNKIFADVVAHCLALSSKMLLLELYCSQQNIGVVMLVFENMKTYFSDYKINIFIIENIENRKY